MTFLYPNFLWALLAISIPIIIHLFNLRVYKIVYFSNVHFLQSIEKQTKARSKLKQWLVLLLRILTITSLVIAFSQPVIIKNQQIVKNNCQKIAAIYLDNSFSMNNETKYGKAIDIGKTKAFSIVQSLPPNYQYIFLTNDLETKQQRIYYQDIIKTFITQTQTTNKSIKLSKIVNKQINLLKEYAPNCRYNLFIISDFQKITADIKNLPNDSSINYYFIPISSQKISNLYIDSVWFFSPYRIYNYQDSIAIKIVNASDEDMSEIAVKVYFNDTLKAIANAHIKSKNYKIIVLKFSNIQFGNIAAKVEINDYPIVYDNVKYFTFTVKNKIPILLIENTKSSKILSHFYADTNSFNLTTTDQNHIPYSQLSDYQAVILNEISEINDGLLVNLNEYINNGGIVVFIPDFNGDIASYNRFLTQNSLNPIITIDTNTLSIKEINTQDLIYKDAIKEIPINALMPKIKKHLKFQNKLLTNQTDLLKAENNDNLLFYKKLGKGKLYIFAFNLEKNNSDFAINPLISPTFYNIPVYVANNKKLYYTLGRDKYLMLNKVVEIENIKFKDINSQIDFIPEIAVKTNTGIKINLQNLNLKNGYYQILNKNKIIDLIAFNYDTKESELQFYSPDELNKLLKKYKIKNSIILTGKPSIFTSEVKQASKGISLWKYFLILALLFLALEIFLLRMFK